MIPLSLQYYRQYTVCSLRPVHCLVILDLIISWSVLLADIARWPHFNGTCGTPIGSEVTYTDAGDLDVVSCAQVCNSVAKCIAITIDSKTTTCRLATECTLRLHTSDDMVCFDCMLCWISMTVIYTSLCVSRFGATTHVHPCALLLCCLQVTILLPEGQPFPEPKRIEVKSDTEPISTLPSCDGTCPASGPCAEPFVCRMGQCFRGALHPDMMPCDDGDALTSNDVCRAGVCQGSHSPLESTFAKNTSFIQHMH